MRVCTPINVRYGETDKMGIVYHANYLLYFEDARSDFLNKAGFPYAEMEAAGYLSPVVSVQIEYGEPLRYGDRAVVRTRVIENKATKTTYAYEVFREAMDFDVDRPLVTGRTVHCVVDAETFKPQSIKRVMPDLFARYNELLEAE